MKRIVIKTLLAVGAILALGYPIMVWLPSFQPSTPLSIFPVLGIIAFVIMWMHVVGGAFQSWIEKYFDFEQFVHITSYIVLVCILLHPLLVFMSMGFDNLGMMFNKNTSQFIWYAVAGFLLLIIYDIGKIFRKKEFFTKHWEAIKIVSTVGFFLIFLHSFGLGSHLQSGFLRILWIFYGLTAFFAAIYSFVLKKLFK